jgi:LuxR family transcriptional regulator, maltose regulon positive regulatory protein
MIRRSSSLGSRRPTPRYRWPTPTWWPTWLAAGALVDQVREVRETVATNGQLAAGGATPLAAAELRLLPYLQTHLTIAEIGELFVSRNTVGSEVSSIYRKFRRSSRNDAVERATAIGLLGG